MAKDILNKHSFSELALLAIFAAGLFFANLLVKARSMLNLGEGIELAGSGLVVHLPRTEDGWNGLKDWQYQQNNCYVLPSRRQEVSSSSIDVEWRYCLASKSQQALDILQEAAESVQGSIVDVQVLKQGSIEISCGRLISRMEPGERYIGAAILDFGRALILHVKAEYDFFYARDVFLRLAGSIEYHTPTGLAGGIKLLSEAGRFGAEKFFAAEEGQNLLIRDSANTVRGYEMTQIKQDSEGSLRMDRTTVINTAPIRQKEHLFESSNPYKTFHWRCKYRSVSGQSSTFQIDLDNNGMLNLTDPSGKKRVYWPGPAAASEISLDGIIRYFLDTEHNPVVLDVITSEGMILPAQISSIPPGDALAKAEEIAYAIKIEFVGLNTREFYYSSEKKLLGKISVEPRRGALLWEPSTRQEIEKYFDTRPIRTGPVVQKEYRMPYLAMLNKIKKI